MLEPWQETFIRELFGRLRKDGTRQYRKAYVEVPRKNGKSTLGAAMALYLLFSDQEPGAEVYSVAADRDQAAIIFDTAKQMVEQELRLADLCRIYRRSIVFRDKAYHVLSADVQTKHGKNSHGIVFDELHAQPNRLLFDVMSTSTGSRRQPVLVMFTTAGYDKTSICWEMHDYAVKVRDGILKDPAFLPLIYAADPEDDWTAEKTWRKANPNLAVSVKLPYLEEECARAQESPAYQNTFRRLHLNQWTEQADRWIDMAVWNDQPGDVALDGLPCYAGLDLASTTDVAAWVLLFPLEDGTYAVRCRFWVPEDSAAQRTRKDRVQYTAWIRDGWMESTEGNVIDFDLIRRRIAEDAEQYAIREVAIDRWNSQQLQTQLQGDGLTVVPFGQGFASMAGPTKELLTVLLARRLRHGNHPVLTWMASNVAVKQDPAGNVKPDKSRSSEKIDGIVALVMALGRAIVTPGVKPSMYEREGLTVL